ncbi:MAG TPA: hypothetical protein VEL82_01585 [Thermoplasmata archaeon]|nr:hypothetical protein [Thermoplasmata archaeon]
MDLHKVRRLAGVLVASQLRSGRSTSNPRSLFGQPRILWVADLVLFLAPVALLGQSFLARAPPVATAAAILNGLAPFLPLSAVGVVLVAGTLFELSATARFSGSDAANWLPITPGEYVAGSTSAIAFSYSPAVALLLGIALPFAARLDAWPLYLVCALLSAVALYEGAFLVEMVRAASQRIGAAASGRRGTASFVLRAVVLVLVILAFDLALNPVFLFAAVHGLATLPAITAAIPLLWASQALDAVASGAPFLAAAFALGQLAFVAGLGVLAARLRSRYWAPAPVEVRLAEHVYASPHPWLAALGLSRTESALAAKDLRGLLRRRELLPVLVVPIVLVLLLAIEGGAFGTFGVILWIGWVAGFFGLLVGASSVGQERRGLQLLFALPVTDRDVFRAKTVAALIPVVLGSALMAVAIDTWFRMPPVEIAASLALTVSVAVCLVLWGLVFASRFSDFQERPRPQFVRPGPMLAATGSGIVLLAAIAVPGALAITGPVSAALLPATGAAVAAVAIGTLAYRFARTGFARLFRELPF